jgi:7-cyano-7-deazaguanine synthase in queuosine biosynthesis
MNVMTPTRLLRVVEHASSGAEPVALLGRDIRTSSERISHYCVTEHEPVYEDLATLVESMAYFDRLVPRRRSGGWARQLSIQIPTYECGVFQRAVALDALLEAAWFLTGDRWSFEFVPRQGPAPGRQAKLSLPKGVMRHIVPFSDGLDSFAQVQLSVREHGRDAVMLVRSGLGRDRIFPELVSLRVPRKFSGVRMREVSYRTRPLVFYTLAAIAAAITQAEAVVIGENGQGAIGPACLPFADEWWFRSAHPGFVRRWARFLGTILDNPTRFEQPQLWKTKAEVLCKLRTDGLLGGWENTSSCSTRPKDRYGHRSCGVCGGCLLRTVSAHSAGLSLVTEDNAFDLNTVEDICFSRVGGHRRMRPGERAVAVRAIATMAEFARLADSSGGDVVIKREAQLIDPDRYPMAEQNIRQLLRRHKSEWDGFMSSLPERSWVREIAGQL